MAEAMQDDQIKQGKESDSIQEGSTPEPETIIINEVQLLLAEKRTSLAVMRTGLTVFVLPLSVLSVLVATSKYYDLSLVMHFLLPLLALCLALIILGSYLIIRAVIRLHNHDRHISTIKHKHSRIGEFID
jgi:uncharacterized membrane protein YidH (DUF202 family)